MKTYTPFLNLEKHDEDEFFNVKHHSDNMDKLDSAMKASDERVDSIEVKQGDLGALQTSNKASLVGAMNEVFQNASNGKSVIADAITGKGGTATSDMTFSQLSSAINGIQQATGDAVASDVLAGKTFSNSNANGLVGNIPRQVYNGSISPVATEVHLHGGQVEPNGANAFFRPPRGFYDGNTWLSAVLPNLVPSNVKAGVNIAQGDKSTLPLIGTVVEGKKWASGTLVTGISSSYNNLSVRNLDFKPSIVIAVGGTNIDYSATKDKFYSIYIDSYGERPIDVVVRTDDVFNRNTVIFEDGFDICVYIHDAREATYWIAFE